MDSGHRNQLHIDLKAPSWAFFNGYRQCYLDFKVELLNLSQNLNDRDALKAVNEALVLLDQKFKEVEEQASNFPQIRTKEMPSE